MKDRECKAHTHLQQRQGLVGTKSPTQPISCTLKSADETADCWAIWATICFHQPYRGHKCRNLSKGQWEINNISEADTTYS
jgi:hypothetical protein